MKNIRKQLDISNEAVEIVGYEGLYKIYKDGRVLRLQRKKKTNGGGEIILPEVFLNINKSGNYYPSVCLNKNQKQKTFLLHRLIAIHFIPNDSPFIKRNVNHKNKNIQDFSVNNLEWCTQSENVKHAKQSAVAVAKKKKNVR